MAGSMERSTLHVEGPDDQHSMVHLLIRHGVNYDLKPWAAEFPEVVQMGGVQGLLAGMETAVQLATGRCVGLALDADSPLLDRWKAVQSHLQATDVPVPDVPPAEGFVAESPTYRSRVGVWLMPDNQHDGKLETLLRTLIAENDPLINHAEDATSQAKELGAGFVESDRQKAIIRTWLAWQDEPGLPYGSAIRAKYFQHESPAARSFVAWFKRLYGIAP